MEKTIRTSTCHWLTAADSLLEPICEHLNGKNGIPFSLSNQIGLELQSRPLHGVLRGEGWSLLL